jgi:hypothetical protein
MVGAKPKNITVKVLWADTTKGLFEYTDDLTSKLTKMKGNAREYVPLDHSCRWCCYLNLLKKQHDGQQEKKFITSQII